MAASPFYRRVLRLVAFVTLFKEATGLTPSAYRDAYGLRNGPENLNEGPAP
jgi:hypothetical protein